MPLILFLILTLYYCNINKDRSIKGNFPASYHYTMFCFCLDHNHQTRYIQYSGLSNPSLCYDIFTFYYCPSSRCSITFNLIWIMSLKNATCHFKVVKLQPIVIVAKILVQEEIMQVVVLIEQHQVTVLWQVCKIINKVSHFSSTGSQT